MSDKEPRSPTEQVRIDVESINLIMPYTLEDGHVLHERSKSEAINYVLKQGIKALQLDKKKPIHDPIPLKPIHERRSPHRHKKAASE